MVPLGRNVVVVGMWEQQKQLYIANKQAMRAFEWCCLLIIYQMRVGKKLLIHVWPYTAFLFGAKTLLATLLHFFPCHYSTFTTSFPRGNRINCSLHFQLQLLLRKSHIHYIQLTRFRLKQCFFGIFPIFGAEEHQSLWAVDQIRTKIRLASVFCVISVGCCTTTWARPEGTGRTPGQSSSKSHTPLPTGPQFLQIPSMEVRHFEL